MAYARQRASPLGCKEMSVVDNLDMSAFAGGWHMAFHQPTIFENGYNSKCTRSDFTLKDGLTNGYEFEMFAQATNAMNSEVMSITLCGKNNDGKLAIGMCDSDPMGDNFWIIHYEEGADGFFLAVGGEPIIPVLQADGSIKCFHLQIGPMQQSGGIFIMTREDTPSEATIDRAKAAVSDAGLIWDNVLSATNHDDCSYKTPSLE